ncbi:MAG: tetratricopeptide repeat protein, partial [Planctomycetaceae bacterium]|nr:tetratricopeptide repeat protein [Planctomycetaceae bacterium]
MRSLRGVICLSFVAGMICPSDFVMASGVSSRLPAMAARLFLATPVVPDRAEDDFNLAVGFFRSKRWDLAEESFQQFITLYPQHARHNLARLYLGLTYSAQEKYQPAREQFALFVDAAPDDTGVGEARYRLAECSYYLRDYQQAVPQFQTFLEKHPGHKLTEWGELFLGDSCNSISNWKQAAATFRQFVTAHPESTLLPQVKFGLGRALEGLGETAEAIRFYGEVTQTKDGGLVSRSLARIGTLQFDQGEYAVAAQSYDRILSDFATSPLAPSAALNSGLA